MPRKKLTRREMTERLRKRKVQMSGDNWMSGGGFGHFKWKEMDEIFRSSKPLAKDEFFDITGRVQKRGKKLKRNWWD